MRYTKLDRYDYEILSGKIRIELTATNDPDLVDIMSEIERSNGRIYIECRYFAYLDNYDIYTRNGQAFLDIDVMEVL